MLSIRRTRRGSLARSDSTPKVTSKSTSSSSKTSSLIPHLWVTPRVPKCSHNTRCPISKILSQRGRCRTYHLQNPFMSWSSRISECQRGSFTEANTWAGASSLKKTILMRSQLTAEDLTDLLDLRQLEFPGNTKTYRKEKRKFSWEMAIYLPSSVQGTWTIWTPKLSCLKTTTDALVKMSDQRLSLKLTLFRMHLHRWLWKLERTITTGSTRSLMEMPGERALMRKPLS